MESSGDKKRCAGQHHQGRVAAPAVVLRDEISTLDTGCSPRSSTRSLLWTITQCSLTIQTSMISLTSRKQYTRTLSHNVSHVSHYDFALQIESKESMHRETDCLTERKEGKRIFCDKCSKVDVKENRRNSTRSHSLQTHREFYSDERDLREHLEKKLNKLFLVKIQFRENYI